MAAPNGGFGGLQQMPRNISIGAPLGLGTNFSAGVGNAPPGMLSGRPPMGNFNGGFGGGVLGGTAPASQGNGMLGLDMNLTAGLGDSLGGALGGLGGAMPGPATSVEQAAAALQSATASVAHVAAMLESNTGKGMSSASKPAPMGNPNLQPSGNLAGGGFMGGGGGGNGGRPMPAFRSSFVMGRPQQKGGMQTGLADAFEFGDAPMGAGGMQGGGFDESGMVGFAGGGFLSSQFDDAAQGQNAPAPSFPMGAAPAMAPPPLPEADGGQMLPPPPVQEVTRRVDNIAGHRQHIEENLEAFLLQLPAWRCGQRDVCRVESTEGERQGGGRRGGGSRSRSRGRRGSPGAARGNQKEKGKNRKEGKDSRSPSRGRKKKDGRSESRGKRRKK